MTTAPATPSLGVGCDYDTHRVHFACMSRDAIASVSPVRIEHLKERAQVAALREGLQATFDVTGPTVLVLEKPWYGHKNADSTLKLAMLVGRLTTLALEVGFDVRLYTPSQWRVLTGIIASGRDHELRAELKDRAVRLVQAEYGVRLIHDQAEAVLMGRLAASLAMRDRRIARAVR